ncbi:hypothetical protein D9M73_84910 [compost metagenome]
MNFLQLCQRAVTECRISGAVGKPVAVSSVGQTAELQRIINWVNAAWMDIQMTREDWQWMRTSIAFPTVTGQATYTLAQLGIADTFGNWFRDNFRSYPTPAGNRAEIMMSYIDYDDWLNTYQFGATRTTTSQPFVATITPDKGLGLGPTPLAGYTVTGDYFLVPSEMVADTDVPALPSRFHLAIVYRAMMFYGASEAASEVYQQGKIEFDRMMTRLQLNQLPQIYGARPLA